MTETNNYTELHVYDFDNTLFSTRHYDDNGGVNAMWIQYILNDGIKPYATSRPERFSAPIDPDKFSINSNPEYDYDQNHRYEVLYDNIPWSEELYMSFNGKIRSNIQPGSDVGGSADKESYYIKVDPKWYYTSKNFSGGDIIWNPTGNEFKKSVAQSDVYTIVMTGRRNTTDLKTAIASILKKNSLVPDELHLSPGGSTAIFKISTIENILKKNPSVATLVFWEDRYSQADKFKAHFDSNELDVSINMVNRERKQLREFVTRVVESLNGAL